MNTNLIEKLKSNKILPIIRSSNPDEVINKVNALAEAGLDILEVNVESMEIYNAISKVADRVTICAGGIITSVQARAATDAGAKIIASPVFGNNLLKISKDKHIPYISGASTANEAYNAWQCRIPLVKIYPVTAMGGVRYIEDLLRPMPFLNIIPQGQVRLEEVKSYIDAGATAVGVGRDLTNCDSCKEITRRVLDLTKKLNNG